MELLEIGKSSIPGPNPAGQDSRDDPDFIAMSAEVEKLSSFTATGTVDWDKVVKLSAAILSDKSKDIMALSYLCNGLLSTRGLNGLSVGVKIMRDMVETFWDNMFPSKKRMRGRLNAIDWWKEKVQNGINALDTEIWTKEEKDNFINDLYALDSFLGDNLPDAPILSSLISEISSKITEPEAKEEKPDIPQEVSTPVDKTPADIPEAKKIPPTISLPKEQEISSNSEQDTDKLIRQGLGILGNAATVLRKQNPLDVMSFRLNRIAAWSSVTALPPISDGRTMIPPPDTQITNAINILYKAGNWLDLLDAAESRIREFLFWIDLNLYVTQSLTHLGRAEVSDMIASQTSSYVQRLPGIEKYCFADGMPFAGEETREWLRSLKKGPSDSATVSIASIDTIEGTVAQEMVDAQDLIKKNDLMSVFNSFQNKINNSSSVREKFIREISFVNLLISEKKLRLIQPHINNLLSMLDSYQIEKWEPQLAVEALFTVFTGLRIQPEKKDDSLSDSILNRITVLNPGVAMDLM
ncbi:MAG: type VI secretion system protein TssA [Smithella sp.]